MPSDTPGQGRHSESQPGHPNPGRLTILGSLFCDYSVLVVNQWIGRPGVVKPRSAPVRVGDLVGIYTQTPRKSAVTRWNCWSKGFWVEHVWPSFVKDTGSLRFVDLDALDISIWLQVPDVMP